jgi:4-azaleucine resistance transporter AzlC
MQSQDSITMTVSNPQQNQIYTRRGEFLDGARDTLPLLLGALPFGVIFGALGISSGLTPAAVMGLSLFVYAGSAQFIAAGLFAQGVGIGLIILTTLIVNLRHALYAASLGPYMKNLSQKWLLPLGFWLTDETYAVVVMRYPKRDASPYKHWYHLGSSVAMYTNWQFWTLVGLIAGTQLEGLAEWGLDFAMVVTFIGIVVPLIKTRPMLICAVVAGVVAVLTVNLPNQSGLMVASLAGIAAGVVAEQTLPAQKQFQVEQEIPS